MYVCRNQEELPEKEHVGFFQRVDGDLEVVRTCLQLTGGIQGTRNAVNQYTDQFKKYDWVWKDDIEVVYKQFIEDEPGIEEVEIELKRFEKVEDKIASISPIHIIGALSLNMRNLKLQLKTQVRRWKMQYSQMVHIQAKASMEVLLEYIRSTTKRLQNEVTDLGGLRTVMSILKEVREREASIDMEINPTLDMYQMLERYLPSGYMEKTEMDQKSILRSSWRKLSDYAEQVTDKLGDVQGKFKK